ncbi:MAG: HAMP domain-containing histidine kinase [Bacteroidetes bacterium]|nr:MAG: HAMP domain-containing histidine kinase [Bacteroidota bacterium]
MFDLPEYDKSADYNSQMTRSDVGKDMVSQKNNTLSCSTVLTGMSHEMRTHMNAIVAFSFLMKENGCTIADREEFSNHILSSCNQLIELFDSFLDSAIIDTGNSKADSKICKLDNILDDLFSEFREILNKEEYKDLELVTEIQFSNSVEVYIDKNKIFRVISSLFQNSVKHTKSGYIKIGYYYKEERLTFYVLDSGQGYFKCKEFLQTEDLNESLKFHNDTHTAINLTLAKKLIQMLDGTIWIESNGLTGAGIYFSIPVKMVEISDININKYINTMIAI